MNDIVRGSLGPVISGAPGIINQETNLTGLVVSIPGGAQAGTYQVMLGPNPISFWSDIQCHSGLTIDNALTVDSIQSQSTITMAAGLHVQKDLTVDGSQTVTGAVHVVKDLNVDGNHSVKGTVNVVGDIILAATAADCAEEFDLGSGAWSDPGMLMILDDMGELQPSSGEYDGRVAGVISGAGEYRPGNHP